MPVLECLFATEAESVNFKVPFRVANYVGKTREERKKIFDNIQTAYNIRSRYIHGDKINRDVARDNKKYLEMEKLIPISKEIDDITRMALERIITVDYDYFLAQNGDIKDNYGNVTKEGLKSYLDKLTF